MITLHPPYRKILTHCPDRQQRVSGRDLYHVISHVHEAPDHGMSVYTDVSEGSNKISHGALQVHALVTGYSSDVTAEGVHLPIDKPLDRVLSDITAR